ncbi:MAG: cobalamin-dependent protein [Deltaproteobacteria bacterium]|nr:cobalamin-dependent protein [Deltaproteobacteria bacterium]MBW2137446.1 cobalamin-dependent protein [Deltaproteobacteria bacterium]
MTETGKNDELTALMADLREEKVLELVGRYAAEGVHPLKIIGLCHKGMMRVGERYEKGAYFISGLIMAGEIMRQVGQRVLPLIRNEMPDRESGTIVLGTVEGDIHFIGKDIFKVLARGHGFAVHDLGVDVSPAAFVAAVEQYRPRIVGLSCLISTSFKAMKETISLLRSSLEPSRIPVATVIGGLIDEQLRDHVGADYHAMDAMDGVRICQEIIMES